MAAPAEPPTRASDDDRDEAIARLRAATVDGRLSHDSFVRRVDVALRAADRRSLADLVADLQSSPPGTSRRGALSALAERLVPPGLLEPRGLPNPARLPTLPLPDRTRPVVVIGRRSDCDVVLADASVSRLHAVLVLMSGRCFIEDRSSTNGTRVNGRRVWGATELRPGDRVGLGRLSFHVVTSSPGPVAPAAP